MSTRTIQAVYSSLASLVFVLFVYRLGRKQKLSFRYTVGWITLGFLGVLGSLLLPMAAPVARFFGVIPSALIGIVAIIMLVSLCVQLSISISGIQEHIRKISEQVALLKGELESDSDSLDRD